MSFKGLVDSVLSQFKIPECSCLPLSDCTLLRAHKLAPYFSDEDKLYVCMITVPYYVGDEGNISEYAKACDYHLFFDTLWESILPMLKREYPSFEFCGFADNSPIDEREAAAKSGLGVIGENGLLITKKYSSYVFIGEIITNYPIEDISLQKAERCAGCGACQDVCPMRECGICLSALTQKKGVLEDAERDVIKKYNSAWGCDRCQEVCPYTRLAIDNQTIYTDIDFFKSNRTSTLSSQKIRDMSDKDFSLRAYSWRKREAILRNLQIIEEDKT